MLKNIFLEQKTIYFFKNTLNFTTLVTFKIPVYFLLNLNLFNIRLTESLFLEFFFKNLYSLILTKTETVVVIIIQLITLLLLY